jgi:hypothetical protein
VTFGAALAVWSAVWGWMFWELFWQFEIYSSEVEVVTKLVYDPV